MCKQRPYWPFHTTIVTEVHILKLFKCLPFVIHCKFNYFCNVFSINCSLIQNSKVSVLSLCTGTDKLVVLIVVLWGDNAHRIASRLWCKHARVPGEIQPTNNLHGSSQPLSIYTHITHLAETNSVSAKWGLIQQQNDKNKAYCAAVPTSGCKILVNICGSSYIYKCLDNLQTLVFQV